MSEELAVKKATEKRQLDLLTEVSRRILVELDIIFHIGAAILLLIGGGFMFYYAILNVLHPTRESIIHLINDVLLVLIILELLWTVIRFLKRQKFVLGPFLAIGVIAVVRRILLIEAQTSAMEHVPTEKLIEMGLSAGVIIVLIIAYYLATKAEQLEQ